MTDKILTSYSASAQIEGFNSIALDGYGYSVRLHLQGWLGILFNIVSYRAKILSEYSDEHQIKWIELIRTWLILRKKYRVPLWTRECSLQNDILMPNIQTE